MAFLRGMKSVVLARHEFHANLLFGADGLDPFFALESTVKAAEGSRTDEFTVVATVARPVRRTATAAATFHLRGVFKPLD